MDHPSFIHILILLAGLVVQLVCAQDFAVQPLPLPVIEGKINGMDVVVQGDKVAFFAGQLPGRYSEESCSEDLHCTLHKNHTKAVVISPEGIRLLQLNPDHLELDEDEEDESSSVVLPSQTLNTLESSSTFSVVERFISTEEIEPTPTLPTLYTGIPVVDQTPGVAWVNSETMRLLSTTIETVNLRSTPGSSMDDDDTLISPSPTEAVKVLTTITDELDVLRRQLMSSIIVPMPTAVQTNIDEPELEGDVVLLETEFEVLKIRPSPCMRYSSKVASSFTYSVKKVGTTSVSDSRYISSDSGEPASFTSDPVTGVSAQPDSPPIMSEQGVEGKQNTIETIELKEKTEVANMGDAKEIDAPTDEQQPSTKAIQIRSFQPPITPVAWGREEHERLSSINYFPEKRTSKARAEKCFHGFEAKSIKSGLTKPEFNFLKIIGRGQCGTVYRALCVRSCIVAIKTLKTSEECVGRELRNLEYISRFPHPNIIKYFGFYYEEKLCHLVFEFCEEQFSWYIALITRYITNENIKNIIFQTLEILVFLNERNVFHKDFRFFNMVYHRRSDTIKLIDFGVSRIPSDADYEDPLSDIRNLGYDLGSLQLDIKYEIRNDEWQKARNRFFLADDVESLLCESGNWFLGLDADVKKIIALCAVNNPTDRTKILEMRHSLNQRTRLSIGECENK